MDNIWDKLKWRLQSVANNHQGGGCDGAALIFVNLFLSNGVPIAWYRPQRVSLEPKTFDMLQLPLGEMCGSWDRVIANVIPSSEVGKTTTVDRVLVVREGEPIAWLTTPDNS